MSARLAVSTPGIGQSVPEWRDPSGARRKQSDRDPRADPGHGGEVSRTLTEPSATELPA